MNIFFVTNAYHPQIGGVENAAEQLARALNELSFRVEIITAKNPFRLPAFEIINEVKVHRLPFYVYRDSFRSAFAAILGLPFSCFKMLYIILKNRPCLVHIHFLYHNAVCVQFIRKILQIKKIPVVVTFHGGDAPNIPETYAKTHRSESKILNWTARRLIRGAEAITTVSESLKGQIMDRASPHNPKIRVIHNGVDSTLFSPPLICDDKNVVLSIGRLSYQKGFDILLKAFSMVRAQHPKWELHVAGDGELRISLERFASELGLSQYVRFLGMLDSLQLVKIIQNADFVVSSSRWEGFSLVNLEVMSCGKTLITTEVEGTRELISHNFNGIIVAKENAEELAKAICSMIDHPDLRRKIGNNARKRVVDQFTWKQAANNYSALYRELLHIS